LRQSFDTIFSSIPGEGVPLDEGAVDLNHLENIVKYVKGKILNMVEFKKAFAATDKAVCMTIFDDLKQKEKYLRANDG
jgi:hypothetical protein